LPLAELTPDQTVGRDQLVADLMNRLERGSLRIEDPRRFGKTSVLKLLVDRSDEASPVAYVNVQGADAPEQVVNGIAKALVEQLNTRAKAIERLRGLVDVASVRAGPVTFQAAFENAEPAEKLERVLAALSDQFPGGHLVLAIDELPWAISNIARGEGDNQGAASAGAFLQALQRFRSEYPQIRWVLAGSIGFHHVLRMSNETNAVLSGAHPVNCGPLRVDDTQELVARLMMGIDVSPEPEIVTRVAQATGGVAFIAHHLVDLMTGLPTVTAETVQTLFDTFAYDRGRSADMTHLLQRLEIYMTPQQAAAAQRVLDECARDLGPIPFETLESLIDGDREETMKVANWLVNDHYLIEQSSGFQWRYPVLMRVWAARRRLNQ